MTKADSVHSTPPLNTSATPEANPSTPEYIAAADEVDDRVGLRQADDQLSAIWEQIDPLRDAINAMPCTSIEGLYAKALVAFWEGVPLGADDTEFHFGDEYPFPRLFCAVAELCGLNGKIAATGFDMPTMHVSDYDEGDEWDDDPDETKVQPTEMGGAA